MKLYPKKISEMGRVVTGKTPSTKNREFFDGEYLFITPSDLDYDHYYVRTVERTVTEDAKSTLPNQFIPTDAVMFTCIGNTIGKCGIASTESLTNQQINSIIVNEEHDAKFIYYLLCNNIDYFRQIGGGSATPIVSKTKFEDMELKVPELDLQCRIASILSAYDDLIENNNRRIQLLEKSARLLYQEWFVRLRFPGYEHTRIVEGVPEGWEKIPALDAMEVLSGGTPKTGVPDYWDGDIPFYTPKDAVKTSYIFETEKSLTEEGLKDCNSKLYPKDTVFITARGTVGNLNLAQRSMAMNQSCYALQGKGKVSQLFLYCAMREGIDYLKQHAVGAVFDAIIVNTFKLIPFLVPEDRFIREFEESIGHVFQQVENLLLQNQNLKAARDLLLPRLMSGEIVV